MHEYPLVQRVVEIALREARQKNARRVVSVSLVLGESSGLDAESVRLYFGLIAEGTAAEGAALCVTSVKPALYCAACGKNFRRPRYAFDCPECGAPGAPTDVGKECYVESVELEI